MVKDTRLILLKSTDTSEAHPIKVFWKLLGCDGEPPVVIGGILIEIRL
jgi:hypothetical protein